MNIISSILPIIFIISYVINIPSNFTKRIEIQSNDVDYYFISRNNSNLTELSNGLLGDGYLIYYLKDVGKEKPNLVVYLKNNESGEVTAEIFDNPILNEIVQIREESNEVVFLKPVEPDIVITSLDRWWTKDGMISFNLDIQIFGPIQATWGGTQILDLVPPKQNEKFVEIQVRDTDHDGLPDWDFRTIIPPYKGYGFLRTNYTEKKCDYPIEIDPGISPLWPYVAFDGGYEQPINVLRPPIIMDWQTGQIKIFSEIVTARNQPCSYTLYTLDSIQQETLVQKTDFESPFAFYNLSGESSSYPNLILRTEHYFENNFWIWGNNPEWETIRYSWRNAIGDQLWDYKVEVLGFNPYNYETSIAGGTLIIDAPSYEQFPSWVLENQWPVITFMDTEGSKDKSSEGIYEWSPRQIGQDYFLGYTEQKDLSAFEEIKQGYRGEYRYHSENYPYLYLSSIDNRLHLFGAEGGLWNLGEGNYLKAMNISGDQYIDGWQRYTQIMDTNSEDQATAKTINNESLFFNNGYFIYSNGFEVLIKKSDINPNGSVLLPPSDHESWVLFKSQVEPITEERKDPMDMRSWLDAFPGKTLSLDGVILDNIDLQSTGFQFSLLLKSGYTSKGSLENPLKGFLPGNYMLEYINDSWYIRDFKPAVVSLVENSLNIERNSERANQPIKIYADIKNSGDGRSGLVAAELWVLQDGQSPVMIKAQEFILAGNQADEIVLEWQPEMPGLYSIELRLSGDDIHEDLRLTEQITILSNDDAQLVHAARLSQPTSTILLVLLLLGISGSGVLIMFLIKSIFIVK